MPRKVKTEKPPLQFLERSLCGARLQNVPEVRAAVNPKDFFTERKEHNNTPLKAWVSPQFDNSVAAAPPLRRGRRKCQSSTSILDSCSQLARKKSVYKFPSLTFQTKSRNQSHQTTCTKKATERTVGSETGNQVQGLCQIGTISSEQHSETPKRETTSIRKRKVTRGCDVAASSSTCVDQSEAQSVQVNHRCRVPAGGASTPTSTEFKCVGPPPDVDTPQIIHEGNSGPSPTSVYTLLLQSRSPSYNQPHDILVDDTPERDYGLKVTWRRRRDLMLLLKASGHLSDSDVLIHRELQDKNQATPR